MRPCTVFVSAFTKYAYEAMKLRVDGPVMKPAQAESGKRSGPLSSGTHRAIVQIKYLSNSRRSRIDFHHSLPLYEMSIRGPNLWCRKINQVRKGIRMTTFTAFLNAHPAIWAAVKRIAAIALTIIAAM